MKSFCPLPMRFATIQMDPVGMVKQYHDDPIAQARAKAMEPRKYLVYLRLVLELPTPTKPWFRYEVCPIATTLRPEDREAGITPDMVVPICPNTSHPSGRSPIPTETPFPFPNCYFWIETSAVVRIRRKAIRYDDTGSPTISPLEHVRLQGRFADDYDRIAIFQQERLHALGYLTMDDDNDTDYGSAIQSSPSLSVTAERHSLKDDVASMNDDADSLPEGGDIFDGPGSDDAHSNSPSEADDSSVQREVAAILNLDYFSSNEDDTIELIPLVDLWFDIAEHFTPETIPSPTEFFKEQEEIMQIIHDARERAPSVRWPFADSEIAIDFDSLSYYKPTPPDTAQDESGAREDYPGCANNTRFHVLGFKTWNKFKGVLERDISARIPWRTRPPCLPFWP
ncbi:hypothetical protein C8Q77DRAFT_291637 [Trametes polyzona]|nr:hypothetical protein C8Q77DRAFT_291637 [Trametes polyzona]